MNKLDIFKSAIFAGLCIGIAGFGFLASKSVGIFLFIFGLATVVSYKLKLFTGTAGFVQNKSDMLDLLIILGGNLVGCLLVALASYCSGLPLQEAATAVLQGRLALGPIKCGVLGIGCGMLMTTAVTFARKGKEFGNWIPLLFAVPLFILCGFPHCIADAFYYMAASPAFLINNALNIILLYICIVIGNFIGCNIYRILLPNDSL